MEKKEINSIPTRSFVGSLLNVVIDGNEVKQSSPGANLLALADTVGDANTLYERTGSGLSLLTYDANSINGPTSGIALFMNMTRITGAIHGSQRIFQIWISSTTAYWRVGTGTGTTITYTNWKQL